MITNGDIQQLARLREAAADARTKLVAMRQALETSAEYKAQIERLNSYDDAIRDLEDTIKTDALEAFRVEGTKAPHATVKIKEFTVVKYDQPAAITWAWDNMPKAFKFDGKAFEKYALAVADTAAPLPFVEISKEPRVEIASDLSKYLEEEPA